MIPLLVSAAVVLVVVIVVSLLTIRFSRQHSCHCQDVDTKDSFRCDDPISTKEMGPSKFIGI